MLQLGPGVIGGELPVHTFLRGVSCSSPRFEQSLKRKKIRDSVV